jgi:hypothetical protein
MKRINLILPGLLFISNLVFGQDTIVTRESYLIGSTVLTGSNRNLQSCLLHGYCLNKVIKHPCLSAMKETPDVSKIKNIEKRNDSLIVSLQIYENCALDFLGEIEIIDKNTINIILHEYGSFASCMCTFDVDCIILLNKEGISELVNVEYVVLDRKKYTKSAIKK